MSTRSGPPTTNRKTRKRHGCSNVTPSAVFSHILVLGRWLPTGFTRRRCPEGRRPSACSPPRCGRRSRCRRRRRYCRRVRPASGSSARSRGRARGMGGSRDWYLERREAARAGGSLQDRLQITEPTRSYSEQPPARARDTRDSVHGACSTHMHHDAHAQQVSSCSVDVTVA